ncbi:MAG: hypothetical protein WBX25_19405 [Rhodomicrobium sp.]
MLASRRSFGGVAAVLVIGALAAGCGGVDVPMKETFLGKAAPVPDLPERPKLVIPPANSSLPPPGQVPQQTAMTNQKPASDSDAAKKQEASAGKQDDRPGWFSRVLGMGS